MEANRLVIAGLLVDIGSRRVSPAGIPQRRFRIEHRSRQVEAGTARDVRCRLTVKAAGAELDARLAELAVGDRVEVEGFLARSSFRDGDASIELHATRLQRLDDTANG